MERNIKVIFTRIKDTDLESLNGRTGENTKETGSRENSMGQVSTEMPRAKRKGEPGSTEREQDGSIELCKYISTYYYH